MTELATGMEASLEGLTRRGMWREVYQAETGL